MKAETTIELSAPAERVFELLMDPNRLGEWVTAHRGVAGVPANGLKQGSSFRQTLRLARVDFHVEWTVTELDAPRLAEWEGRGPRGTTARVVYELEPNGDGTTFHYLNEVRLPGGPAGIAAGKLVSNRSKQAMKHSLKKLQKLLGTSD